MKPTLAEILTASLAGLAIVLGLLFYIVFSATRAAIVESSERIRNSASREIGDHVAAFLGEAPDAVRQFEFSLHRGAAGSGDPSAIEAALFGPLLADPNIGEIAFTYGEQTGSHPDGAIELATEPRGEWRIWRTPGSGGDRFWSRHVYYRNGAFVASMRELAPSEPGARYAGEGREEGATDPTSDLTFTTPASKPFQDRLLWSDLHWAQIDAALPERERRGEVSVQQSLTDAKGNFAGVVRVGLLTRQLDRAVRIKLTEGATEDPHRVFICDGKGRLITRGDPDDVLTEFDDDLRIAPGAVPEPVASALLDPKLRLVGSETAVASGSFRRTGEEFLTTFRMLPATQDWIVGIVVPRSFYLGKLTSMRDRLLLLSFGVIQALVLGSSFILRSVKRAQSRISRESAKMNAFDFSPAAPTAPFRDVAEVLEGLEKSKTAMRAMSKYVPVDLVRRLYREKSEPTLGGEETELSIMFTDIKDFTTLSEQLDPNTLAAALGSYLDAMARIIQQETRGTIDKYIGDAIMTIWNAPEPVPNHARMACIAALRCRGAGRALAEATEWRGLPPFETRFGLHCGSALVGHFGAHDRMNYTAIGDAVNLASRLESLNKQYGTSIIASAAIVQATSEFFRFRLLDCVAVKGKTLAINVYELLGEKSDVEMCNYTAVYETAFDAYLARDFNRAIAILSLQPEDPPSAFLSSRCVEYVRLPPPPNWNGVHVAEVK